MIDASKRPIDAPANDYGLAGLSDSERLLVCCLQTIASDVAARTVGMSARDADRQIDAAWFELRQSLGQVSESFADETERYLRHAVAQARPQ